MENKSFKIRLLLITIVVMMLLLLAKSTVITATELAETMYNFNPGNDDKADEILESALSQDLFNYISLSNPERQMYTYLKFENKNSEIEVLESSWNSVTFKYVLGPITSDRTFRLEVKREFIFDMYEILDFNFKTSGYKISNISEVEMYFLPPTTREEWYNAK